MRGFLTALHFLTRLKIYNKIMFEKEDYQKSIAFFPLVGFILGIFLLLLAYISELIMQPFTTAVLVILFEALLTGGLHLDGFMDSCDGLLSGRERSRMLEIMKDSRVGAMGVLSVLGLLLLKAVLITELPRTLLFPVILVMPMLGRVVMVYAVTGFSYARNEGLGSIFHGPSSPKMPWPFLYSLIIFLLVIPWGYTYLSLPLLAFCIYILSRRINNVLGGFTGDIYGMLTEISEVIFLFWCVIISRI